MVPLLLRRPANQPAKVQLFFDIQKWLQEKWGAYWRLDWRCPQWISWLSTRYPPAIHAVEGCFCFHFFQVSERYGTGSTSYQFILQITYTRTRAGGCTLRNQPVLPVPVPASEVVA